MATEITVETLLLRRGLLDVLLDGVKTVEAALSPVDQEQPRVHSARRHYARVRAIGELLEAIEWTPPGVTPYRLDIQTHGWAAITALERVIAREHFAAWEQAEIDEAEGAGDASGSRLQAEHDLALIQAACRQAKLTITSP